MREDMKTARYLLAMLAKVIIGSFASVYKPSRVGSAIAPIPNIILFGRVLRFQLAFATSFNQVFQMIVIPSTKCTVVDRIRPP